MGIKCLAVIKKGKKQHEHTEQAAKGCTSFLKHETFSTLQKDSILRAGQRFQASSKEKQCLFQARHENKHLFPQVYVVF